MDKRTICSLALAALALTMMAQSGTRSPYSQYGLGTLSDRSQGFNRGMNGVGQGFRNGTQVNTLNPASYSAVDSLTMLFDMGLSAQKTNFKEGGTKVNASTANFEYVVGLFRLKKNVGVSFGVLPYTNVGYEYQTSQYLNATTGTVYETYTGSGGLRELYLGAGWQVVKGLSVGVNAGYLWGGYERSVASQNSNIYSLTRTYKADVNSYKIDLGVQYTQRLGQKDVVTLGATYGLGHKLGCDPEVTIANQGTSADTTFTVKDGLELPATIGGGLTWSHGGRWTVGADFELQKWGSTKFPALDNQQATYALRSDLLKDRKSVRVGGEWLPNAMSRNLLNRIRYRLGVGYATPYYIINGQDGPKEMSVSAGLGIPLQNVWNNRSVLNISAQWAHSSATGLITENTFRINVGLTFNERWFAKWKVE